MTSETSTETENPLAAIRYAAGTDVGMKREENQDSYGILEEEHYHLYIVADGMGGVKGGAVASSLAITTVEKALAEKERVSGEELVEAIHAANGEIFQKGNEDAGLSGMGTTFVGLLFSGTSLHVVNVGDSRAYLIRGNMVQQMTEDHTLVRELMRQGAITAEQAEHHPVAHMLTRSLGPTPEIQVDHDVLKNGPIRGDRYLLCSDGLYNLVSAEEIGAFVQGFSADEATQKLIDLANSRGGSDNITIVIVEVGGSYPVGIEDIEMIPDEEPAYAEVLDAPQDDGSESDHIHASDEEVAKGSVERASHYVNGDSRRARRREERLADAVGDSHHEQSQMSEEDETEYVSRPRAQALRFLHLIVGVAVGTMATYLLLARDELLPPSQTTTSVQVSAVRENPTAAVEEARAPTLEEPVAETTPSSPLASVSIGIGIAGNHFGELDRLGPTEKASIAKRKKELEELLAKLDRKLGMFDKPLSGDVATLLNEATTRSDEINTRLESIRGEVDAATRRLAVWYGRRKRLDVTPPINMASEVAVSSEDVRLRKEAFEKATWEYLKEVEVLRYNRGDKERIAKVEALIQVRSDRSKELESAVRNAIESAVSDADHRIAELTLERDKVEAELEEVRAQEGFVKVLTGGDDSAKASLRVDLTRRREGANAELTELKRLLPE